MLKGEKTEDLPFGRKKNYCIATLAGLTAGPFFLISPMVMAIIHKSDLFSGLSNKTKWYVWAGIGAVLTPALGLVVVLMGLDSRHASIEESIQEINSTPVTMQNYREKNSQIVQLLKEQCFSDVPEKKCMSLDNDQTYLLNSDRIELNPALTAVNNETKSEAAKVAAEAAQREEEKLKAQSLTTAEGIAPKDEKILTEEEQFGDLGNTNNQRAHSENAQNAMTTEEANSFYAGNPSICTGPYKHNYKTVCKKVFGGIPSIPGLANPYR